MTKEIDDALAAVRSDMHKLEVQIKEEMENRAAETRTEAKRSVGNALDSLRKRLDELDEKIKAKT